MIPESLLLLLLLLLGGNKVAMVMTSQTCETPGKYAESSALSDVIVSQGALANLTLRSRAECAIACSQYPDCRALCWAPGHTTNCYLHCGAMTSSSGSVQAWSGASYLYLMNGSQPATSACPAPSFVTCKEHFESGIRSSDVYRMSLNDGQPDFDAFCDMETDGGGWTVFLNRANSSVNFDRTWSECEAGFGDMRGNHWLGLTYIHRLTKAGVTNMRVDVTDWSGGISYAKYTSFTVNDSSDSYRLRLSGYSGNTGSAGLNYNNNNVFGTKDRDVGTCAKARGGPWWFSSCTWVQPMSPYATGGACSVSMKCMVWYQMKGWSTSMKSFRFMLR